MKVPKVIYDVYKSINHNEHQLMAIAVLQQGWGRLYCDKPFPTMEHDGFSDEKDDRITKFVSSNKVELAKAILNDDIELGETSYNVRIAVLDYITSNGVKVDKYLYAKKSTVGGGIDFVEYEGSIYNNPPYEFSQEEIDTYNMNDFEKFDAMEVFEWKNY